MPASVAKIAVSAATYFIDRPYEYRIPEELRARAVPGARVLVPFSRGNRKTEGIILALSEASSYDFEKLKDISSVADEAPVLTPQQLQLALFMRERFFCTVYDAVKAMLPAGLWLEEDGRRRVGDKTQEMVRLALPGTLEEAELETLARSPQQKRLLRELASYGELPSAELCRFAGVTRAPLKALVQAGHIELYEKEIFRLPPRAEAEKKPVPELNAEQSRAYEGLRALQSSGRACAALLEGVTGSGKTSVYIHLIQDALREGKTAILLVPEIALTPQMLQTFSSYFGDDIAVLHSSLTTGERYDEWKRLRSGKAHLAIGTRSCVFAPVEPLGVLIIDEEQEDTYRSENAPRYDAVEVAKYRCVKEKCLLLLGSATPNICSRHQAQIGKYSFITLKDRYNRMLLPAVRIVDMNVELRAGNSGNLSYALQEELTENLRRGEQSILFLNRRGAHKLVTCGECGFIYKCPKCSVSLTYHSVGRRLQCHYCGYVQPVDDSCPECGGILKYVGAGTQLIEEELHSLYPESEILRIDADVLTGRLTHEQIFDRFRQENVPFLVGTQMVTKGLNFENVTLVGVISADQSLYCGDYRAAERTFSLITQVIGRSGRGSKPGRAVIQTFTPKNEVILQAAAQDYEGFYQQEIALRQLMDVPPFADILAVTASGERERTVVESCRFIRSRLEQLLRGHGGIELLGPTPLAVVKVNDRYRYRVYLKCSADSAVRSAVSQIIIECSTDRRWNGVSFYADNDPE